MRDALSLRDEASRVAAYSPWRETPLRSVRWRRVVDGLCVHCHRDGEGLDLCGRQGGPGRAVRKTTSVESILSIERLLAHAVHGGDAPEEHVRGSEERKPGGLMVVVMATEEGLELATGVQHAGEEARVVGLGLQRREPSFA